MPPTLKRILWAGVPTAVLLAGLGFALAEATDLYLAANRPVRGLDVIDESVSSPNSLPRDPVSATVRRTLPLTMAAWGFGVVVAYEGLRRLIKGPTRKPSTPSVLAPTDVDKLLADLMRKAEADRAESETVTPPPAAPITPAPVPR